MGKVRQSAEVLTSRGLGDPAKFSEPDPSPFGPATVFFGQIRRHGSASEDMPAFVETFREHPKQFGAPNDEESVCCSSADSRS